MDPLGFIPWEDCPLGFVAFVVFVGFVAHVELALRYDDAAAVGW